LQHVLEQGTRRVTDLLAEVQTTFVEPDIIARYDPHGCAFFNLNTPADLKRAQQMLAETA
jgi:molybdopterin-guanine dinucleotide biosynthesis protein A